jgi:hypothetical protein
MEVSSTLTVEMVEEAPLAFIYPPLKRSYKRGTEHTEELLNGLKIGLSFPISYSLQMTGVIHQRYNKPLI